MGMSLKPVSLPRRARGAHPNAGRSGLSCKGTASPHLVFAGARFSRARLGARPGDCNIEFVFNITTRGRVRTWACGAEWGAAVQPSSATSARCVRQAAVDERPLAFPTIFSLHENPGNPKKILKNLIPKLSGLARCRRMFKRKVAEIKLVVLARRDET